MDLLSLLSKTPAAGHRRTPKQPPMQSAGIVWASWPLQGSAGRAQGENCWNDFRSEFSLLDKTHATTNADVHEQSGSEIVFLRFRHDFGGPWASRKQPRRRNRNCPRKVKPGVSFSGGYFGSLLFPNRFLVHFVCVNFYVYFWHRFWEASGPNFEDLGVISGCLLGSFWTVFRRCCETQQMQPFKAKCLIWDVLGLRFCIHFACVFYVAF